MSDENGGSVNRTKDQCTCGIGLSMLGDHYPSCPTHRTSKTLRAAYEEWCRVNCSPGGSTSEFYWKLFQAGAEAAQRAADETPAGRVSTTGWLECQIHGWWHPPDVACKDCDPVAYRNRTASTVKPAADHSPAACDHLYRHTTPRVCIYCGIVAPDETKLKRYADGDAAP